MMQLRSNQRKKLSCTFLALTLREVIPLKKMGQNFHICLRSGPTGLTPPPLTVSLTVKYTFFTTSLKPNLLQNRKNGFTLPSVPMVFSPAGASSPLGSAPHSAPGQRVWTSLPF